MDEYTFGVLILGFHFTFSVYLSIWMDGWMRCTLRFPEIKKVIAIKIAMEKRKNERTKRRNIKRLNTNTHTHETLATGGKICFLQNFTKLLRYGDRMGQHGMGLILQEKEQNCFILFYFIYEYFLAWHGFHAWILIYGLWKGREGEEK